MRIPEMRRLEPSFTDTRGEIFNLLQNVGRIALITFTNNAIRGNHYHRVSIQYALITKGEVEIRIFHKDNPIDEYVFLAKERDLVIVPPNYVHIFKANAQSELFDMMDVSNSLTGDEDTFKYEK